jgi:hypothetical protein
MIELQQAFQLFAFALPWLLAILIPFVAVTTLVVGRHTASWWVGAYFTLILYFPSASWGVVDAAAGDNFYTRATGTFYFSAINLMLFGLVLQAFFARRFARPLPVLHNLGVPALLFGIILVGNLVVGLSMRDVRWFQVIGYSGLLNVANFMFAFYVLVAVLREPRDLDRLVNLLLFCAVTRGLWGLVRFVALGGDPANFYENFQHLGVKLTFFDINDSLIATLAMFIAGWRLASGRCQGLGSKLGHWAIVLLELFIIVFSYRRIGWGGLVLAALLFAFSQRPSLRWGLLASYVFIGLPGLAYKMTQRAGEAAKGGSLLERMFPDVVSGGHFNFTTGRFSELYAAWLSLKSNLVLGLGAWGRFDGFRFSELAWHRGDFSWMHSGMMHIMLKTGLFGAALVLATLWLYLRFVMRHRHSLPQEQRGVLLAGVAGVLFMLPTWAVGTPVIEFRTMQLLALCFALPYLAAAAAAAHRTSSVADPTSQQHLRSGWGLPRRRSVPVPMTEGTSVAGM